MQKYYQLSLTNPDDLMFGRAAIPVTTRRGLVIGRGKVYPELNFTVPPMQINEQTFPSLRKLYRDAVEQACVRACELDVEGFVIEFETLLEMTMQPCFAIELTKEMNDVLEDYYAKAGLKTALRITPNDLRELKRPPVMRSGELLDRMFETFAGCAREGAELLSIESTGGKEIHDEALLMCDLNQVIFSLAVMGCRDMAFLWQNIVDIAAANGSSAGGDTACGFGNTAMVLAEKHNIPKVFAAVDRAVTAVRSLVAYEYGASGPGKDCGYENIFLKAITGFPMSMEGKSAACAHSSPLGNIASAACDLWSNESVQNIKLLGGMAPTVSFEQLSYDCRLMNTALDMDASLCLRDMMVRSDVLLDPQAYILAPENVIRIATQVVAARDYYQAAKAVASCTIDILKDGVEQKNLRIESREMPYLDAMQHTLRRLPDEEEDFIQMMMPLLDQSTFIAAEYDLA